jgi:signal transduction histidine kinase
VKGQSIQKRLLLAVVISQVLLALGLTCAGALYTRRRVMASLDESLRAHATSIAALVRFPEDGSKRLLFDQSLAPKSVDGVHSDVYRVSARALGIVGQSPGWPQDLPTSCKLQNGFFSVASRGVPYRVLCLAEVPMLDREEDQPTYALDVFYAAPSWTVRSEERAAGLYIALASVLLMSGTTALAWWGIRRSLLPLQHLADQASRISALNWEFHSPPEVELTDELRPLTMAMKTMLQRLENSFSQQREFLGNAAHELKTPVAILKSTLQRLIQKPRSSFEYETGILQALEDMDRLETLLHSMLRLARAEQWANGTLKRNLSAIDIAKTCEAAIERLRTLAQKNGDEVQFTCECHIALPADPEDLETVWANLLENAIRYSPRESRIGVHVGLNGDDHAKVVVEDHGEGISQSDLHRIFERFHRADASRARDTGRFGLGLAISKALVEAYGGKIRAESELGRGTRMIVELPLSPK